jgi:hypothetical protein
MEDHAGTTAKLEFVLHGIYMFVAFRGKSSALHELHNVIK